MKGAVAYAYAVIDSPKAQVVELRAGSPNGLKIFLNGKPIFAREEYHHGVKLDQYSARGTLKAGRNEILLKVCQNEQSEDWAQAWKFQVRVCDFVGAAVPFTPVSGKATKRRSDEQYPAWKMDRPGRPARRGGPAGGRGGVDRVPRAGRQRRLRREGLAGQVEQDRRGCATRWSCRAGGFPTRSSRTEGSS